MKLTSIERIHSICPHPDIEVTRIELAKIKGWPIVIPKGQFKDGDLVVFFVIDSIIDKDNPAFSFMEKQKYRVWNARFRKAPSSGLVQPLTILSYYGIDQNSVIEGQDVTAETKTVKYEIPISVQMSGETKGGFPSNLISVSDELNLLGYPEALNELFDKEIVISSKIDGSSATFVFNNGEFDACSRRQSLKEGQGYPWQIEKVYSIRERMVKLGRNLAIGGEVIGPGLNGNRMGLLTPQFKVYRMKNLDTNSYLDFDGYREMALALGLDVVDVVERLIFNPEVHTIEYFRNLADSQIYKNNGKRGEGVVICPTNQFYSSVLGKNWSAKLININYS